MSMPIHNTSTRYRRYATADEIKQRVGILDVSQMLGLGAELHGSKHFCRCFCERQEDDRTPSVFLDESDDHFHCFIGGCGKHGDIFNMVCVKHGWNPSDKTDFKRAKDEISQHFGIWPGMSSTDLTRNSGLPSGLVSRDYRPPTKIVSRETRDVLNAATHHYAAMLWQDDAALQYVHGRGLSNTTIRKLKLGYAPGNTLSRALFEQSVVVESLLKIGLYTARGYEKLAGYVILPVLDGDDTVFMQGRSPETNPAQEHDSLPEGQAHKLPMAMGNPRLGSIVAEGSFDFATPIEWGLDTDYGVVGLLGTGHNLALSLRAEWLVSPVVLGLDQDCAGKRVALLMQEQLTAQGKQALIPVDLDRLEAAQAFITQCERCKRPMTLAEQKRWKSAEEHIELATKIQTTGSQVAVRWGMRKDFNDLLRWGTSGRSAFQVVLEHCRGQPP